MSSKLFYISLIACCLAVLEACNHPEPKNTAPAAASQKPALMAPFRYHKLIESSPGVYFDVLTWGRGKDSIGGYLILHSDSTGKKYTTVTGDLEGAITDVFNTDMNMDGYPEILIISKAKDTTEHVNIYVYEYRNGIGQKINFPKLSDKSKSVYHGGDNFYIEQGNLVREFPVYSGTGKDAKPTGKKRILQYGIRDNVFTVKDISPVDSTAIAKKDSTQKPSLLPSRKKTKPLQRNLHTLRKNTTQPNASIKSTTADSMYLLL